MNYKELKMNKRSGSEVKGLLNVRNFKSKSFTNVDN